MRSSLVLGLCEKSNLHTVNEHRGKVRDFQAFEEQDEVNRSYQLGVGWRGETGRGVRLMLERYDGFSPNGQVFNTPLEFWGLAVFVDL